MNGQCECVQVFGQMLQLPELPSSAFLIHFNGYWEGNSSFIKVKFPVKFDLYNFDILLCMAKNVNKNDFRVSLRSYYEIVYC